MKGFRPEQVINGTWGEVWFDNEYLAQVTACKAEVGFKKTAITQVQSLVDGQKITGFDGVFLAIRYPLSSCIPYSI